MLKSFFCVILVSSLCLFIPHDVSALSIAPTRYFLTVNPGDEKVVSIDVKNDTPEKTQLNIFVAGITQNDNGALVLMKNTDQAEGWIEIVGEKVVMLESGEDKNIDFIINVPPGVGPESHFLGLAAESVGEDGAKSAVKSRLFSILSLQVAGEVRETVSIEKWQAKNPIWSNDFNLNMLLKNNSNIDVPIKGELVMTFYGKEVGREQLQMGNNMLAGSLRNIEKKPVVSAIWPGFYEAEIKIVYGRTLQPVSAMIGVWYLPIWAISSVFFIILIIVFFCIKRKFHEGSV